MDEKNSKIIKKLAEKIKSEERFLLIYPDKTKRLSQIYSHDGKTVDVRIGNLWYPVSLLVLLDSKVKFKFGRKDNPFPNRRRKK